MSLVSFLLGLAPALVLLLALAGGRYPGERILARVRERRAPGWAPVRGRCPRPCPRGARRRAGELLASSLAGRSPPGAPA
jgi:hypothetical protein